MAPQCNRADSTLLVVDGKGRRVMDEVEAFACLVDGGMSADDVTRRFGCTAPLSNSAFLPLYS